MAEEVRRGRHQISSVLPSKRPIGKSWLDRFRTRHPEIKSVWTRKIERVRYTAVCIDTVKTWFEAVTEMRIQHQHQPEHIYNMDESGFAVGDSQTSRALINVRENKSWKVIQGRQEWITAIECVSASGVAIPPLLIFKAKHTNTAWIPQETPPDWHFSTSNSGWTSDSHGYEWISRVFEPLTRPNEPSIHRLLIMDGHSSHITANMIAFCIEHAIDLLILPPHTSHKLQPLDVGVFSPLKRALAAETDALFRLSPCRIQRVEWTEAYIRARANALTTRNLVSGWKATGLEPLSPITVLEKLEQPPPQKPLQPQTPGQSSSLDLSLLDSSPPEGTELREANTVFLSQIRSNSILQSPAKRYAERLTRAFEATQSTLITVQKQLAEQHELLQRRKSRTSGKRVKLKGRFVFSTAEVLQIAKEAEEAIATKKTRKKRKARSISMEIEDDIASIIENHSCESDSDCIVVADRQPN